MSNIIESRAKTKVHCRSIYYLRTNRKFDYLPKCIKLVYYIIFNLSTAHIITAD